MFIIIHFINTYFINIKSIVCKEHKKINKIILLLDTI